MATRATRPHAMRQFDNNEILNSVVEITEEQDLARFRRSLCGTIREIMPIEDIAFVKPISTSSGELVLYQLYHEARGRLIADKDEPEAQAPLTSIQPSRIVEMMNHGHFLQLQGGMATLMLPVLERETLVEIFILRASAIQENALAMLKAYIRLYRNFRVLIIESERDALTGMLNRKALDTRLGTVLRDAHQRHAATDEKHVDERRGESPKVSDYLAILDLDFFKRINDTLGHVFGDEVLILVSRLMRESFREEDVLFRFGGEEFIVILLTHSFEGTRIALERFRASVAEHQFPQLDKVTVSIGFAEIRPEDIPSSVVGRADQALYYAKEHGRDQVCSYSELNNRDLLPKQPVSKDVELF